MPEPTPIAPCPPALPTKPPQAPVGLITTRHTHYSIKSLKAPPVETSTCTWPKNSPPPLAWKAFSWKLATSTSTSPMPAPWPDLACFCSTKANGTAPQSWAIPNTSGNKPTAVKPSTPAMATSPGSMANRPSWHPVLSFVSPVASTPTHPPICIAHGAKTDSISTWFQVKSWS